MNNFENIKKQISLDEAKTEYENIVKNEEKEVNDAKTSKMIKGVGGFILDDGKIHGEDLAEKDANKKTFMIDEDEPPKE